MSSSSPPSSPAVPETAPDPGGGYAELFREIRGAGLMDRRHGWYAALIGITALAFAGAVVAFVLLGDSWWQLGVAAVFAVLYAQIGFIGHDAGHGQILDGRRSNDVVGYLHGDLLIGLGYGWWVDKHNEHHANPNHEDRDPDVDLGVLALTPTQADVDGPIARGRLGRFVIRHQAGLFFPILLLEGFDLHRSAVRSLFSGRLPFLRLEIVLLALHTALYLTAVFLVLSPGLAVAFIVVHQGLFGLYLGCSFAPGHKGMPMPTEGERLDPVRRQVLTSRNIRGGPVVDVALGGLNYQIEHHLFPRMPRPHLRRAQPLVRAHCERHGISYTETGLVESYARGLRHLRAVSAPARA
jgi:fatty acid desaturase